MTYILKAVIEWFFTALLLPIFSLLSIYFNEKKAQVKAENAVNELKKAKTKDEIDSAIDHLP